MVDVVGGRYWAGTCVVVVGARGGVGGGVGPAWVVRSFLMWQDGSYLIWQAAWVVRSFLGAADNILLIA